MMKPKIWPVLFLLSLLTLSQRTNAQSVKFSPKERRVITIADERRNPDSLLYYLHDQDEQVAWRAAIGLANLADTSTREALQAILEKEQRQKVQDGIYFALGVLGATTSSSNILQKKIESEHSYLLYQALGRVVPKDEVEDVVEKVVKSGTEEEQAEFGVQVVLRKIYNADLLEAAKTLTNSNSPVVRWKAAYVYGRTDDSALLVNQIEPIKDLLLDLGSPEARMFAALALGKIHNQEAEKMTLRALRSEKEWRVQVNLLQALSRMPKIDSEIILAFRNATEFATVEEQESEQIALTAFTALEQMIKAGKASSSDSTVLRNWLEAFDLKAQLYKDLPQHVRSASLIPLSLLNSKKIVQLASSVIALRERFEMEKGFQALVPTGDTSTFQQFLAAMPQADPQNLPAFINTVGDIWERAKGDPELMQRLEKSNMATAYRHMILRMPSILDMLPIVSASMSRVDSSIVINEAFREEAREYFAKYITAFLDKDKRDQLLMTLSALKQIKDTSSVLKGLIEQARATAAGWGDRALVDTGAAALVAMGAIPKSVTVVRIPSKIDFELLENAPDSVVISAPRGVIIVKLDKENAPLTSLNFIKLISSSYYTYQLIHRLVPNFVIQSGDPTGSGEGGPNYQIRTEISPVQFDTPGVIGMASSGKDTEGSQWFITHLPTPHLDTRYTAFGIVTRGMEHVNKSIIFDRIDRISLYK